MTLNRIPWAANCARGWPCASICVGCRGGAIRFTPSTSSISQHRVIALAFSLVSECGYYQSKRWYIESTHSGASHRHHRTSTQCHAGIGREKCEGSKEIFIRGLKRLASSLEWQRSIRESPCSLNTYDQWPWPHNLMVSIRHNGVYVNCPS